jgi:hypothetical protein
MCSYECKLCNYITNKCSNYKMHIRTNKHISRSLNFENKTPLDTLRHPETPRDTHKLQKVSTTGITCIYCGKTVNTKHIIRHYINSCILIPDNIKKRYIINHNNNKNTKFKLPIIDCKSFNVINNYNNIINNNTILINKVGNESIDHISHSRILEILGSGDNMLKEYCKEIYKVKDNLNAFIDSRNKLITYVKDDKNLEIETMNTMVKTLVYIHMARLKELWTQHKLYLTVKELKIFEDTYNIFKCIINKDNIDDRDYIEKEHNKLNIRLTNDIINGLLFFQNECKDIINFIKLNLQLNITY